MTLPPLDHEKIRALRDDVRTHNWNEETMLVLLSERSRSAWAREQRTPALVELRQQDDEAALLARLFTFGDSLTSAEIQRAFPRLGEGGLIDLALIEECEAGWKARFSIQPHSMLLSDDNGTPYAPSWWVLSDLSEGMTRRRPENNHVLGAGGASRSLLNLTIRKKVERALDLGCGCGIQALYATTHATSVIATDISPRACHITRFNALLNDVDIQVREGSFFEPVAGEKFDLIVSNPPFVITPQHLRNQAFFEYRDAGLERDRVLAQILAELPQHLENDGIAQMLANWEILTGLNPHTQWDSHVRDYLGSRPLDAWIVQRDFLDPSQYVEMWLRDSGMRPDQDAWENAYSIWLEDFEKSAVAAIGFGALTLRKTNDDPVVLTEYLPSAAPLDGMSAARVMAHLADSAISWGQKLVVAGDVSEERHHIPGQEQPSVILLRQGGHMRRELRVSSELAALVGACDGELTLGQITAALAQILNAKDEDIRRDLERDILELIRLGMLQVAE